MLDGLVALMALGLAADSVWLAWTGQPAAAVPLAAAAIYWATSGVVVATVLGVLVLWMGWFLVTMLRLAPGALVVSPTGVWHRSLTSTCFIPWYAMVAVSADWLGAPIIAVKAFPSADTRAHRYLGRFGSGELSFWPIMVIRTGWLASDPTIVYHALSFSTAIRSFGPSWPHRRRSGGSAPGRPSRQQRGQQHPIAGRRTSVHSHHQTRRWRSGWIRHPT